MERCCTFWHPTEFLVKILEVLHRRYTIGGVTPVMYTCFVEEVLHFHQKCRTKDVCLLQQLCKIFTLNWKKCRNSWKFHFRAHVRQQGPWNYVTVLRKSPKFPRSSWILKKKLRFQWCVRFDFFLTTGTCPRQKPIVGPLHNWSATPNFYRRHKTRWFKNPLQRHPPTTISLQNPVNLEYSLVIQSS